MIKQVAGCLIVAVTLLSCSVVGPQQSSATHSPFDTPDWYDTDSLRATYLFTEGVRVVAESGVDTLAAPYFQKVLEIDSLHAPSHHQLSLIEAASNPSSAVAHSQIAHKSDTTNVDYLGQLAYVQTVDGQLQAALQNFNKLLRLESHNPYNYRMAAALYAQNNMPYMAISVLDSAAYKLGHIPELWSYKRELMIGVKLYDRAIEETLSVVANNPYETDNYRILGELYAQTGNDSLAQVNFDKAVNLAPESKLALLSAAKFYLSNGQETKYLATLQRLFALDSAEIEIKLALYDNTISDLDFYRRNFFGINTLCSLLKIKYPNNFEVTQRYATHLIRAGEPDKALEVYKEVVRKPTANIEAFSAVIDLESYLGRRDSVMHYLDKAIEKFPTEGHFHLYRAYELQLNNAPEKNIVGAYKDYLKIANDNEGKSDACASLGDYYFTLNKPQKSFDWYARALEYNANNSLALNNWAYFISELIEPSPTLSASQQQDLERALDMSKRACELTPSNATYIDTQAWILHLLGRNEEAKPLMRQAISLNSRDDDTLLFHYAEILAALGEDFMAEIYYNRAIKAGGNQQLIESKISALKQK